jgi:hypothetical protein
LWRIDSAREKLERRVEQVAGPGLTREQVRANPSGHVLSGLDSRPVAQEMINQLIQLRARCQRYTSSFVTPMGDEMFYRYQEALIDDLIATLGILLQSSTKPVKQPAA